MLRSLAVNSAVLAMQYALAGLVPLLLIPFIVREVGLAQYGELAVAMAWATYGVTVVQYAFHISGPVRVARLTHGESALHAVCTIGSAKLVLLLAVLTVILMVVFGSVVINRPISLSQIVLLLGLPIAWTLHTGWYLQAVGRFTLVALISVAGTAVTLMLGFYLVSGNHPNSMLAAAIAMVSGPLVAGGGTLFFCVRQFGLENRKLTWHSPFQELYESFHLFISQFVAVLYSSSGPIVVSVLAGVSQAGAYSVVERVCSAVVGACLLIHVAAYPKLAQLYVNDRRAYLKLLKVVILAYLSITITLAAVAAVNMPSLQGFLFGASYGQEHVALLVSGMFWVILGIFGPALTGYYSVSGNSSRVLPLTIKILVLSVCCGILGVFLLGAWAWLAALSLSQVIVLVYGWRAWLKERFK